MFYSKVGAAWAKHEYGLAINGFTTFVGPGRFAYGPATASDTLVGWTVGTGVKVALTENWFVNAEYDYMNFGSKAQNLSAVCAPPGPGGLCGAAIFPGPYTSAATFTPSFNHAISEVKVGLNYKFPSGSLFFW
jgi:opacity protein-like surface antigen